MDAHTRTHGHTHKTTAKSTLYLQYTVEAQGVLSLMVLISGAHK